MRVDRGWIYAGLAVAGGVGLVKLLGKGPLVVAGKSRVLLVGDSLAVGLTAPLKALAEERRVGFGAVAKQGTRIDQWAQSQKLDEALAAVRPTIVLVSLGTNDTYMQGDAAGRQAPYLDALLAKLGGAKPEHIVWIGAPALPPKSLTGTPLNPSVLAMIRSKIPRSHYYASEALEIPRGPDGLHPTARGYAGWAGAIWQWLA